MKINKPFIMVMMAILVLSACNLPGGEPASTETQEEVELPTQIPPTETAAATELPPTATPNVFPVEPLDPAWVAYDFTDDVCGAHWSTNASQLPCPGILEEAEGGYIQSAESTVLEGGAIVEAPLLIGLPGSGYPSGLGLFGHYSPFTVYPGDTFQASIACQGDADCDLEFALEYFDAEGYYHGSAFRWFYKKGDGPLEIKADIGLLAGQTLEFLLVMRTSEGAEDQWGVWVQPHIRRDPDAEPLPTAEIPPTPEPASPGVISGMVDMAAAPPYLKDPMTGGSTPVVVVFFNLSDGTYWWIHTSLTGHPYFQMTIPPGEYQIAAYARGVGDLPYVAAGYTGQNPSCGQDLKTVTMEDNGGLEDIIIADWNWTCGGTAYRPPKPSDVPLP